MSFTKGPWRMSQILDDGRWGIVDSSDRCGIVVGVGSNLTEENARLIAASPSMYEALKAICDIEPRPFDFPADWEKQIAACEDCKRWRSHPIQQGICDTHRRPLWAREKWQSDETKALGYRAKDIARAALLKAEGRES